MRFCKNAALFSAMLSNGLNTRYHICTFLFDSFISMLFIFKNISHTSSFVDGRKDAQVVENFFFDSSSSRMLKTFLDQATSFCKRGGQFHFLTGFVLNETKTYCTSTCSRSEYSVIELCTCTRVPRSLHRSDAKLQAHGFAYWRFTSSLSFLHNHNSLYFMRLLSENNMWTRCT